MKFTGVTDKVIEILNAFSSLNDNNAEWILLVLLKFFEYRRATKPYLYDIDDVVAKKFAQSYSPDRYKEFGVIASRLRSEDMRNDIALYFNKIAKGDYSDDIVTKRFYSILVNLRDRKYRELFRIAEDFLIVRNLLLGEDLEKAVGNTAEYLDEWWSEMNTLDKEAGFMYIIASLMLAILKEKNTVLNLGGNYIVSQ